MLRPKIREDRATIRSIKSTPKYPSRRSLRASYEVKQIINKFLAQQRSQLGEENIEDKYYIESHFPPRDILTELAGLGEGEGKGKMSTAAILVLLGLALLIFKT